MTLAKKWIGTKEFYRSLILLILPIAFQQLLSSGIVLYNAIMVGKWGALQDHATAATAVVNIGNRYLISMNGLIMSIAIAFSLFLAQYWGAKQKESMQKTIMLNFYFSFFFAVLVIFIGFLIRRPWIQSFLSSGEEGKDMQNAALSYYVLTLFSLLPLSISHVFAYALRTVKETKIPLWVTGISFILHLFLVWLFLFHTSLGIKGVAIATLISKGMECFLYLLFYFVKKPPFFGFPLKWQKGDGKTLWEILKKGKAVFVSQLLFEAMQIFFFFAYAQIERGNQETILAVGLTAQVVDICYALIGGMGTATAVFIGANIGKNEKQKAKQRGNWILSYVIAYSLLLSLLVLLFIPLSKWIYGDVPLLKQFLFFQAITLPFLFYSQNVMFIMRSGGYTRGSLYIVNLPSYLVKLPVAVLFIFLYPHLFSQIPILSSLLAFLHFTPSLVTFLFFIDRFLEIVRAIIATFLYHKIRWYERKLIRS